MNKKVLAITITYNRLELTKKYLGELKAKAGYPFEHIVVDNGLMDGTPNWLEKNGYAAVYNKENIGISKAFMRGYEEALKIYQKPDYILKFDNDCEIVTESILDKMVNFMVRSGDKCVLAPIDRNLDPNYEPKVNESIRNLYGENVKITTHLGGMFCLIPRLAMEKLVEAGGIEKDVYRGHFWIKEGFRCVYLKDLFVRHMGFSPNLDNYKF